MDPRRPLCPQCEPVGDGSEDISEIISNVDEWAEGHHVCVVCDRHFTSPPRPRRAEEVLPGRIPSSHAPT